MVQYDLEKHLKGRGILKYNVETCSSQRLLLWWAVLIFCFFNSGKGPGRCQFNRYSKQFCNRDQLLNWKKKSLMDTEMELFDQLQNVTRAEAAIMLGKALELDGTPKKDIVY